MAIHALGKIKEFREELPTAYPPSMHDIALAQILTSKKQLVPSFSRLCEKYQLLIVDSLSVDFEFSQFLQAVYVCGCVCPQVWVGFISAVISERLRSECAQRSVASLMFVVRALLLESSRSCPWRSAPHQHIASYRWVLDVRVECRIPSLVSRPSDVVYLLVSPSRWRPPIA